MLRLDSSGTKNFKGSIEISERITLFLSRRFKLIDFDYQADPNGTIVDQLSEFLVVVENKTLVLLIDEKSFVA